jgi:hypothetical protein
MSCIIQIFRRLSMKYILLLFLMFLFILPVHAEEKNYCHDKESWKEWDELVAKYPHNMDIQMLHAVRIGFCKKIEDGNIDFETARDVFNELHETVYERAKQERQQALEKRNL